MSALLSIYFTSALVGITVAFIFFRSYFIKRRAEVQTISEPALHAKKHTKSKQAPVKRHRHKIHDSSESVLNKQHHPLDLNTLKGHTNSVTGLCFSDDGSRLATACADGVIRIFQLDDTSSKNFKLIRINLPAGNTPVAVVLCQGDFLAVASQDLLNSSLYLYGESEAKAASQAKPQPAPSLQEIKWKQERIHEQNVKTLVGAIPSHANSDGSKILVSCSEGTAIKIWHAKSGNMLALVDSNQLKNTMADISPNGRFVAAAAFTADVKIWEISYAKDGSFKGISKVMQLKGHKSAVTWLCFSHDSERIITASKDGSLRIWNINVRYHLDEDPKVLLTFPIPLHDSDGMTLHYDHLALSPDEKILAATSGSALQWISLETGKALDTAINAHDGNINHIGWAPKLVRAGEDKVYVLATAGEDKKVKLWAAPSLQEEQ